jgi:hypothetical protein
MRHTRSHVGGFVAAVGLLLIGGCLGSDESVRFPIHRPGQELWWEVPLPLQRMDRSLASGASWGAEGSEIVVVLTDGPDCYNVPADLTITSADSITIRTAKASTTTACSFVLSNHAFATLTPPELSSTEPISVTVDGNDFGTLVPRDDGEVTGD